MGYQEELEEFHQFTKDIMNLYTPEKAKELKETIKKYYNQKLEEFRSELGDGKWVKLAVNMNDDRVYTYKNLQWQVLVCGKIAYKAYLENKNNLFFSDYVVNDVFDDQQEEVYNKLAKKFVRTIITANKMDIEDKNKTM